MKSTINFFSILLALGALVAMDGNAATSDAPAGSSAAKPTPKLEDFLSDPVVAKGKGFEIRRSQMDESISNAKRTAAAEGRMINPDQEPILEHQILDYLLKLQLLGAQANDSEKAKGKEAADKEIARMKERAASQEKMELQLKAVGLTVETLRARLAQEATAKAFLRSKVSVSDDEVKKFYQDNPSQFEVREIVRASHLMISTRDSNTGAEISEEQKQAKKKQIEGILKRARDGEDFAKLVNDFSDDKGPKETGGIYAFPRGQLSLMGMPELEAAVFTLETNHISDVVTTSAGYHLVKVYEKIPPHRLEFEKASTQIREYLEGKQGDKVLDQMYPQLKKDAGVEILDENLKAMEDAAAKQASTPADKPKDTAK